MSANREVLINSKSLDEGKAIVTVGIRELIPTAKYANIELFASVTNVVDDASDGITENLESVDKGLETKRDEIMEALEGGN